jgi:hypothetical protein
MAWNISSKGTPGQVLADINGINCGPLQLEVNSLGYAQTAMRSMLSDIQSKTLTKSVNNEITLQASGQAMGDAINVCINLQACPLDNFGNPCGIDTANQ